MHGQTAIETNGHRLAIELGTEVLIESPRVAGKLKSALVGMIPNQCLILRAPELSQIGPLHTLFPDGESIVARYLYEGTVFGFRSSVLGTIIDPVHLIFLSSPSSVQEHNIRASQRLDCFIPCLVGVYGKEGEGTILDISKTGCQCLVRTGTIGDVALEVGKNTAASLRFRLPGVEQDERIQGHVRRAMRDELRVSLGISFDTPIDSAYERIYDYLSPVA